jgi:hypothetical protein
MTLGKARQCHIRLGTTAYRNSPNPVTELVLFEVLLCEVLEVALGEGDA